MRSNAGYLPVESQAPLLGLETSLPSTRINSSYSPKLLNMVVRDGVVRRRAGGDQVGRRLMGRVLGIIEFQTIGGTPYNLALTSRRQYAYIPASKNWLDITQGQTSLAVTVASVLLSTLKVAGDHTAVFIADFVFPVVGGLNEGIYTVVSSALIAGNTVITVAESVISTNVSSSNIILADDLTTEDDDFMDFGPITDINGKRFLLTNGRDTAQVWDGDISHKFADWAPTFTNLDTFKTFEVFAEHLFLGGVTVNSVEEPLTLAWSNAGDFDDFESGDSGVQILYQLSNGIKTMAVLGDRLAIYSQETAMTGVYIGPPAVFAFEVVIPDGLRFPAPQALTSINVGHIYLSEENFYLFDGTRGLRILGDSIYTDYKGVKNSETIQRACALNDFAKRTLYFAVPDLENGTTIYTALYDVFNLAQIIWCKEKYFDVVTSWGFFINRDETLTWEDASWESPNISWFYEFGSWGEEGEQLKFPIRSYGTSNGRVLIVTEGAVADRGHVPLQSYETMDFAIPDTRTEIGGQSQLGRWGEIEFEAFGTQVNVIVSTDKGKSYHGVKTVPLEENPIVYRVPIDFTSNTLRVKFISSGNIFAIRWVRLWVRPGGPND